MKISDEKANLLAEYENVSSKASYSDISDDTLAMAAKNFPTESILKTLARLA